MQILVLSRINNPKKVAIASVWPRNLDTRNLNKIALHKSCKKPRYTTPA